MRRLAVPLALLVAVPAAAQEPEWVGVWEGRIGNSPVRLCMEQWGQQPARGAYYYLSELDPVALSEEDGGGGWIERGPDGDGEAQWIFAELTATAMRGNRRYLRVIAPFDLRPVAWTEGEWGGACSSAAFVEPRLRPGEIVTEQADLGGWRYTRQVYKPAAHFADSIAAASFTFAPEQPGDRAILEWLAARLPRGTMDDPATECIAGALSTNGSDGYFDETLAPVMVSRNFLTVQESSDTYCGGAHPNAYVVDHVFDRRSGEELDLFDWIGEPRIDGEDSQISAELRALVVSRYHPDEELEDCREVVAEATYWQLGLAEDGLVLRPDLPHVVAACAEATTVDWQSLTRFLDAEGRAGLARLRGG